MTSSFGRVEYADRAFEQDASQAMGGDIVRALVELITNADDAYGDKDGDIDIEVNKTKNGSNTICVFDTAIGLDAKSLQKYFSILGGQVSGFSEGKKVRGLLGRGAKDTAIFGKTRFTSIYNGKYAWFELKKDGTWKAESETLATDNDYRELKMASGENGLKACITVDIARQIPTLRNFIDRLRSNCQLRDITAARSVKVKYKTHDQSPNSLIVRWDKPDCENILSKDLAIDGYPDATAYIEINKLTQMAGGRVTPESINGIEVAGTKAVFANENFGETGAEMGWIFGRVTCAYIDRLIRDYDSLPNPDEKNPSSLLRRDRDGLEKNHPFYRALRSAVLYELQPILNELQPKKEKTVGGEKLKDDLAKAGKQLATLLKDDLHRLDETDLPGGAQPTMRAPIILIPPIMRIPIGKKRSVSILIKEEVFTDVSALSASSSDESSARIVSMPNTFRAHSNFEGVLIGTAQVEGIALGESTITISGNGNSASSLAVIVPDESVNEIPPDTLEWAAASASCTINKQRGLLLRAPLSAATDSSLKVDITADSDDVELVESTAVLEVADKGWLEARVQIVGRKLDTTTKISATSGKLSDTVRVRVTVPTGGGGGALHIEIYDSAGGHFRGELKRADDGFRILVFAKHPAIAEFLGKKTDSGSWENEQKPTTRGALAEAVTSILVDWLIKEEANKNPNAFIDAEMVLADRNKHVYRYLPVATKALATQELPPVENGN